MNKEPTFRRPRDIHHANSINRVSKHQKLRFAGKESVPKIVPRNNSELLQKYRDLLYQKTIDPISEQKPKLRIPERLFDDDLGNPDLPIWNHKQEFLNSVANNQLTILVGETGSGKTTQASQFLLECGYYTFMTEPRRYAAMATANRVTEEVSSVDSEMQELLEKYELIGTHTSEINTTSEFTRLNIMTNELKEVHDSVGISDFNAEEDITVVFIDEIHEWQTTQEVLLAQLLRAQNAGSKIRIVLGSATINEQELIDYCVSQNIIPNIVRVEGRTFPVERHEKPETNTLDQVMSLIKQDKNTMAFLPGVGEIDDLLSELRKKCEEQGIYNVMLLPLHSKLTVAEQERCSREYPDMITVIAATNSGQTSITPPRMDAVVSCGLERRVEIDSQGIEGLYLRPCSRADINQQFGRVGRTHPGEAYLVCMDQDTKFIPFKSIDRTDFPVPEIARTNLSKNILRTAVNGYDFTELNFVHQIDADQIKRGKHHLRNIGALDENNRATNRGRRINQFPLAPALGRMITVAEEEHMSTEVKKQIAAICASIDIGGLQSWNRHDRNQNWRQLVDEKGVSDHLTQLELFRAIQSWQNRDDYINLLHAHDLDEKNVKRAQQNYDKILKTMHLSDQLGKPISMPYQNEKDALQKCVTAGMIDSVYTKRGLDYIRNMGKNATLRQIGNRSIMHKGFSPELVVGTPYDVPRKSKIEGIDEKLQIIQNVSATALDVCVQYAPLDMYEKQANQYVMKNGEFRRGEIRRFADKIVSTDAVKLDAHDDKNRAAFLDYINEHPTKAVQELRRNKKAHSGNTPQKKYNAILRAAIPKNNFNLYEFDANLRTIIHDYNLNTYAYKLNQTKDRKRNK